MRALELRDARRVAFFEPDRFTNFQSSWTRPEWHVHCSRFVRVLGCAGASRPLVRVLRVLHVVLGVRRCLGARGKVT